MVSWLLLGIFESVANRSIASEVYTENTLAIYTSLTCSEFVESNAMKQSQHAKDAPLQDVNATATAPEQNPRPANKTNSS